ncbi:MAG: hypothetical protein HC858_04495 [Brachymonas sp.]|nr:hypothetical protein [Brachymonas sp.]
MQTIDLRGANASQSASWLVFRTVLLCVVLCWLALVVARFGMSLWLADRVSDAQAWRFVLREGFRFDGVLLGLLWFVPVALLPWFAWGQRSWAAAVQVFTAYGAAVFTLIIFMEISTPSFIHQYDTRPNYLFVEYLKHWREVGSTLLKEYPMQLVTGAIAVPLCLKVFWRLTASVRVITPSRRLPVWMMLVLSLTLFTLFVLAGRGATGRRPANPAMVAVTKDHWSMKFRSARPIPCSTQFVKLVTTKTAAQPMA